MPVPGISRRSGDSLVTQLPGLEPWEQEQLQLKREVAKPEIRHFDVDDPEFEKLATIPMMVLKGISKQQGEAAGQIKSAPKMTKAPARAGAAKPRA